MFRNSTITDLFLFVVTQLIFTLPLLQNSYTYNANLYDIIYLIGIKFPTTIPTFAYLHHMKEKYLYTLD